MKHCDINNKDKDPHPCNFIPKHLDRNPVVHSLIIYFIQFICMRNLGINLCNIMSNNTDNKAGTKALWGKEKEKKRK